MKQGLRPARWIGTPFCLLVAALALAEILGFCAYTTYARQGDAATSLAAALANATEQLQREAARAAALEAQLRRSEAALRALRGAERGGAAAAPASQQAAGAAGAAPAAAAALPAAPRSAPTEGPAPRSTRGSAAAAPAPPQADAAPPAAAVGAAPAPGRRPAAPRPLPTEDPATRITHAPWGECGGNSPPRGMKHPDCRWAWEGLPDPRLIVEVGGNKGDDLKNLAAMYPGARIHSFEPVGIHFRELERLFGRSSDQVVLHHVGASDSDARVAFRVDGDVAGSSQFGQARSGPTIEYENVSLRDAHELFREVVANESRSIDVLSVNCEGCEYAVLERLLAKGWLDQLKVVQVSWHASSQIQQRVERRCALRAELQRRLRPLYQADFGWEGWSALPRAYAVDERFLGETPVAVVGRANAIPQAQSDLRCAEPGGVPAGAGGLDHELDPHPSHLTWPQTALGDVACEVLSGRSFRVPPGAAGDGPVVVEVGAGDGLGVRFRDLLALHPSARVHSFEPVRALRARLEGEAARRNATNGTRTVWGVGLAAASGRASFRVWGPPGDGWSGRLEEVQLEDAEAALAEVQRREGRAPDLVYLNCEGCEYEVLERLASSGRLASLPRLAVSWHAGGAPWRTRCAVEARLREAHTLARSALSWEFWVLQGVQVHDKLAGGRLVSARSAE